MARWQQKPKVDELMHEPRRRAHTSRRIQLHVQEMLAYEIIHEALYGQPRLTTGWLAEVRELVLSERSGHHRGLS